MHRPAPHIRPCPCCGGPRAPWGPLPPDRLDPSAPSVSLVRCRVCGTLETDPGAGASPREEGTDRPSEAYLPHAEPGGITGRMARWSQDTKRRLTERWERGPGGGGGLLVDVGCGSGGFLSACRRRWPRREAAGMEPDPRAAEAASRRGFRVVQAGLDAPIPDPARGGHLYTLWHVLEHVPDPAAALGHLRSALAPEGRIVMALPNAGAWERAVWGRHTIAWDPPRHRWHFSPRGLEELVEGAGLAVAGRFTLLTDDVYDAAGSARWLIDHRAWTDPGRLRGRVAMLAGLAAAPLGAVMGLAAPRDRRASLGYVLEHAGEA